MSAVKEREMVTFWGGPQDGARMPLKDLRGMKNMKFKVEVTAKDKLTDLNARKVWYHLYVLNEKNLVMTYAGQVDV